MISLCVGVCCVEALGCALLLRVLVRVSLVRGVVLFLDVSFCVRAECVWLHGVFGECVLNEGVKGGESGDRIGGVGVSVGEGCVGVCSCDVLCDVVL